MIFYGLVYVFICFLLLKNCWQYYPNKKELLSELIQHLIHYQFLFFTIIEDYVYNTIVDGKADDLNIYNKYFIF